MRDARFLLRPSWLLRHLLVLVLVVVMVNLGFWQLGRHDERREQNDLVEARQEEPVAPVEDVLGPDTSPDEVDRLDYRRVRATGTYRVDEQVLVRNRSFNGAPGSWVLTPLVLDDGTALVVSRGWVPLDADLERAEPPDGEVTVEGYVQETQERGSFGPTDPAEGTLDDLARVDVERLDQQVDEQLLPAWVQLAEQDPAQAEPVPAPVPLPEPDAGPHLSYAGQWFIFSAIAAVGYVVLLRRSVRRRAPAGAGAEGPGAGDAATPGGADSRGRGPDDGGEDDGGGGASDPDDEGGGGGGGGGGGLGRGGGGRGGGGGSARPEPAAGNGSTGGASGPGPGPGAGAPDRDEGRRPAPVGATGLVEGGWGG